MMDDMKKQGKNSLLGGRSERVKVERMDKRRRRQRGQSQAGVKRGRSDDCIPLGFIGVTAAKLRVAPTCVVASNDSQHHLQYQRMHQLP
jgi:hypothetical protein